MQKPRPLVSDLHYPLKLGCWNTRGWPLDSQFRSRVILSLDLDLIGICETFLQGNNEIHLEGYTWLGNNRKQKVKFSMLDSPTGQRQIAFYWMNKMALGPTVPVWTIFL